MISVRVSFRVREWCNVVFAAEPGKGIIPCDYLYSGQAKELVSILLHSHSLISCPAAAAAATTDTDTVDAAAAART